jgi:hypothetical protein
MTDYIFDLDLDYDFPKYDLQHNLKLLEKLYSNEFLIKYTIHNKIISFKVNFIQKLLPNNLKFYRLIYKCDNRYTKLNNFMIDFIDIITNKLNDNSYINDIHKTNDITGTEFLLCAMRINQILGTQKINLIDIASIKINEKECDLSFIKLLENNKTFYMKYGFDFEISLTQLPFIRYENLFELKNKIYELLERIKKIKLIDIKKEYIYTKDILNKISKKDKFYIKNDNFSNPMENIDIFLNNPIDKIIDILNESNEMIELISKYNDIEYLYELFIKLFNMNSKDYLILHKYFVENKRTKIIYENNIISRDYIFDISVLLLIRNSYYYEYKF